jgi:hypothetical protein
VHHGSDTSQIASNDGTPIHNNPPLLATTLLIIPFSCRSAIDACFLSLLFADCAHETINRRCLDRSLHLRCKSNGMAVQRALPKPIARRDSVTELLLLFQRSQIGLYVHHSLVSQMVVISHSNQSLIWLQVLRLILSGPMFPGPCGSLHQAFVFQRSRLS